MVVHDHVSQAGPLYHPLPLVGSWRHPTSAAFGKPSGTLNPPTPRAGEDLASQSKGFSLGVRALG